MSLDQGFAEAMGQLAGPDFPSEIALAVSGGGDSMAMLYLAHNWSRVWGVRLRVVTVDHGFRPEAKAEADLVARECAGLGWRHKTVAWQWDGTGNKMEAAREARLRLLTQEIQPVKHLLMAHTLDDVAETFLMRLKRGSGVDGLSAMAAKRRIGEETWLLRPCLAMRRSDLRHYLKVLHGEWAEDPSNDDPAYDRARLRAALPDLDALGLSVDRLAKTALAQSRARAALWARARSVWADVGQEGAVRGQKTGDLLLRRDAFSAIEPETQLRLIAAGLSFVSGIAHRPRLETLETALDRVLSGGAATLHGCEIIAERAQIRLFRELAAIPEGPALNGALWDGRWRLSPRFERGKGWSPVTVLGDVGWQSLSEDLRDAAHYKTARCLPMVRDATGGAFASPLHDAPAFDYCPMGRPGLTFDAFLASH